MQTSLRCRRLAAALSRWRQTSAALQQEAMELRSKAATMADVQAEAAVLRAEVVGLREALAYEAERWRHIRVSSSLTEVQHWERLEPSADLWRYRWWPSWCPCCKRPLDVTIFSTDKEAWAAEAATRGNALPTPTVDRFAYAASLWGTSPGFVLGALVLGQALRRSGTRHDLVLMHTDDVPMSSRALLEEVWSLRLVDFVDAASGLFTLKGGRFDGVFTKLHVLGLTEYAKVLMLDIDIAVLHCPDDLFELSPPAAMCRGRSGAPHGSRIDGRFFFAGEVPDPLERFFEWSQHGGINAGVMLLAPDAALHARALREVTSLTHPERVPGNGPEQDYLSRLFAPSWSHINVAYNFQLHHVFFALESALQHAQQHVVQHGAASHADPSAAACAGPCPAASPAESSAASPAASPAATGCPSCGGEAWLPERLTLDVDCIHMVHFSGTLKMWDRDFAASEAGADADNDFVERLIRDCSPYYCRLFLDRAGEPYEYEEYGVRLSGDNGWAPTAVVTTPEGSVVANVPVASIIDKGVLQLRNAARRAAAQWRTDLEALPTAFPRLPALSQLLERLSDPSWPADAAFKRGARVEVYWKRTGEWYAGTVVAAQADGSLSVDFDEPGFWGSGCRGVEAHFLRPVSRE